MKPTIIYKTPGSHFGPHGKTYDYFGIDEDDPKLEEMLKNGWHRNLESACGVEDAVIVEDDVPEDVESAEPDTEVDDISPPTREEIELKAKELGIKFDKRMKDETILNKIEEALNELD